MPLLRSRCVLCTLRPAGGNWPSEGGGQAERKGLSEEGRRGQSRCASKAQRADGWRQRRAAPHLRPSPPPTACLLRLPTGCSHPCTPEQAFRAGRRPRHGHQGVSAGAIFCLPLGSAHPVRLAGASRRAVRWPHLSFCLRLTRSLLPRCTVSQPRGH